MNTKKILCLIIYNSNEYYNEMKKINEEYFLFLEKNSEIMNSLNVFYIVYKNLNGVEYLLDDNILYINGTETYMPGILNKTISAIEICTHKLNIQYDYILRSNASTVINYHELFSYIEELNVTNNYYYIGPYYYLSWYDRPNGIIDNRYHGTRFCGGTFILINKILAINLINNKEKLIDNIIDDVSIGQYINTLCNVTEICIRDKISINYDLNNVNNAMAYCNNTNKNNRIIDVNNFKKQIDIIKSHK